MKKQGQVLLCGIANVGKSTLINQIANHEFSVVCHKPQTTRKQAKYLYEDENFKILFVDTPGFHTEKTKLDSWMNKEINKNFKDSNCVLLLYDLSQKHNEEIINFLQIINKKAKDKFLIVFTKKDLFKGDDLTIKIEEQKNFINQYLKSEKYIEIDYLENNTFKVISSVESFLVKEELLLEADEENDNFLISETIRVETLKTLRSEIPYGIFVKIEEKRFDNKNNTFYIEAIINCEKNSHKGIIVGSKGSMIKKIGTNARQELLKIFDCNIFLSLKVKVSENWRNNEFLVKKMF